MTEPDSAPPKTPSEKLAKRVADRLVKESLLSKKEAEKLLPKIAAGTVKTEDWRLAFEITHDREVDHEF